MGKKKYTLEGLKPLALEAIKKFGLFFVTDLEAYMPCTRVTMWKLGLNDDKDIVKALNDNKINVKVGLRQKWYKSNSSSLQMALYKLVGTDEERDILNSYKIDMTTEDTTHLTPEERALRIKELREKLDGDK